MNMSMSFMNFALPKHVIDPLLPNPSVKLQTFNPFKQLLINYTMLLNIVSSYQNQNSPKHY